MIPPHDLLMFDAFFEAWAHAGQLPPGTEGWRTWLMMAGRGFGKTRAGAEWIHALASRTPELRIALVGASLHEARMVMVEGVSGLLSVARNYRARVHWEPSLGRLTWRNGSVAQIYSGDTPDGLRGPECDFAWCDELAKWRHDLESWDNLQMGLRRGPRARALITTTPRPSQLLERLQKEEWTVTTTGRTSDNMNLDPKFVEIMTATYGGTRLGAQELDGVLFSEAEGALWTRELIERSRAQPLLLPGRTGAGDGAAGRVLRQAFGSPDAGDAFDRIVVGVDPPGGADERSDACGIVVAGSLGETLYVLEDASVQGLRPEGWSRRVASTAARWKTVQVVAEANNGGVMVESVLKAADLGLKVRLVHASKGKSARAEPIALKFEVGKALFAGHFPQLEAQLAGMIAGGGYEGPGRSPDRADAMVWALTVLSETRSGVPRVRRL
jgi:phage terminase large subunit-like protein